MKYKTFQQKLDRFKREPIGFLVKSKEIADELAKVFTREGMVVRGGRKTIAETMDEIIGARGINAYVTYNYFKSEHKLSYGLSNDLGRNLDELLDITIEELKSYNAPQALEDKLKLFKAGTHVLHTPTQEIYNKFMVELEKRGYVWQSGDKPTSTHKEWELFSSGTCICCRSGKICKAPNSLYKEVGYEILTLTPADFTIPQVITITSDGYHRTTAESNGVTAEALCNPTDKFSIHKGSHMALKRLLEKLDEDTIEELGDLSGEPEGFHVGDIVEVVRCDFSFADEVKGVQGVITKNNDAAYRVKFPVKFDGYNTWAFYDSELKLVRKYNA